MRCVQSPEIQQSEQQEVIDLGLRVFPLNGKKPPRDFHWKEEACSDIVITPCYGIVCDKIAVVDTDTREKAVWWYSNRPRTPWMVKTPRGGVHFYYLGSPDLTNGQYEDMDLRAGGKGYVVGPGSRRDGKEYELVGDVTLDLPQFDPAWLPLTTSVPKQRSVTDGIRNVRAYIAKIESVSGSGGHNAAYRVACKLADAGLSEAEVLAEMIEWNRTNASPPWELRDLVHKTRDACTRNL